MIGHKTIMEYLYVVYVLILLEELLKIGVIIGLVEQVFTVYTAGDPVVDLRGTFDALCPGH